MTGTDLGVGCGGSPGLGSAGSALLLTDGQCKEWLRPRSSAAGRARATLKEERAPALEV